MIYKLGDFVRFVDEKMEGYVTRIIDGQMIGVTGADDFEIPVMASKVTSVHGFEGAQPNAVQTEGTTNEASAKFDTQGVYLAVVSDARAGSVVHFHLVNDSSFQLAVTFTTDRQEVLKGEYAGLVAPKASVKLYAEQLADLQLWPRFKIALLFFTTKNVPVPPPLVINEKFKAKDFAGAKKQVPILNEPGWLIRLDEPELVIDAEKLKESFFKSKEEKIELQKPAREVDLHIEKLRDDYRFLSNQEMLAIQLAHFHATLEAAIVHQYPDIVFIHGVGNGTLKHEIQKALSKNNRIRTFMDAHKEKFGYGATKVLLK